MTLNLQQDEKGKSTIMRIRKRTTVVSRAVAVMIIVGFFVSGGSAQERGKTAGSEAIAQLYAGAKKEGTVVIWGRRTRSSIKRCKPF